MSASCFPFQATESDNKQRNSKDIPGIQQTMSLDVQGTNISKKYIKRTRQVSSHLDLGSSFFPFFRGHVHQLYWLEYYVFHVAAVLGQSFVGGWVRWWIRP